MLEARGRVRATPKWSSFAKGPIGWEPIRLCLQQTCVVPFQLFLGAGCWGSQVPGPVRSISFPCTVTGAFQGGKRGAHPKQGPLSESCWACFVSTSVLIRNSGVFSGQRDPAFSSCLMWSFPTISETFCYLYRVAPVFSIGRLKSLSKGGPWGSRMTWELTGKAESQVPSQAHWIQICFHEIPERFTCTFKFEKLWPKVQKHAIKKISLGGSSTGF